VDSQSFKTFLDRKTRYALTAIVTIIAILIIWWLWVYYQYDPWTRDGRLRADVVKVAPDVSGLISEIYVKDNEVVKRGQKLFAIDELRFIYALEEAEAKVASAQAALYENMSEDVRNRKLGNLASTELSEQTLSRTQQFRATLDQAISNRNVARLNLERSIVRAPVNGMVTNFELQPGDYAIRGEQTFALIDTDTLRIEGYFEETKLRNIQVNNAVVIRLMGEKKDMYGHVVSIAGGIYDRERNPSPNQLPNINPTFNWVRLAQRIPVRISLDCVPDGIRLVSGRTATVKIMQGQKAKEDRSC
jgi:multidrug resistance efflux pump